jgi:hypothetical protein
MKRTLSIIMIVLMIAGALTGCGPDPEKIQKGFIAIMEKPASEETIKEATDYLDDNLSKLDEKYTSDMVLQLEHYTLSFDQNGIVYEEWAKHYDKYISDPLKDLYKIRVLEQKTPATKDAVLMISWAELVQRTYDMELYIEKYKNQALIADDAKWLYGNYINTLAMGTNGTPIFDYKTYAFSEDAQKAYAAFINQHPDSVTAWALTEYFTYLESIRFSLDYNDKVQSKLFFDTCDWLVSESGKRVFQ